jgi:thioredoxin reductase (NADPH)
MKNEFDADLLILGAGPAGLSAAQYGSRANLKTVVVEEMAPGGQVLNIARLENYPGNFEGEGKPVIGGFEFSENLHKQAEHFGAAFVMEGAASLRFAEAGFVLGLSGGGELAAPAVILATGAKRRLLGIPGEDTYNGRGVSYCGTCDGPFFKGKRILVVGGGDAACDEAQFLSHLSDKVTVVHRRNRFRAQKALADRVLSNRNISVRFNRRLVEIKGDGNKVTSVIIEDPSGRREEPMDAVFIFVGSVPQTDLVKGLGAAFDEGGYVITDQCMATNVPGLYAAGDVRSSPFRQVVTAASDGAIAAHCASAYIDGLKGEAYR